MKTPKFIFKTSKPTGKWRSFDEPTFYIKYQGKVVGMIDIKSDFPIRLMVVKNEIYKDSNPNCSWMWKSISLGKAETLEQVHEQLNKNIQKILDKYTLHASDL